MMNKLSTHRRFISSESDKPSEQELTLLNQVQESSRYLTLKENQSKRVSDTRRQLGTSFLKKNSISGLKRNMTVIGSSRLGTVKALKQISEETSKIEQTKKSFRQVLDRILSHKHRKKNFQISICFASLFSFLFYVLCTYFSSLEIYLNYFDFVLCACYAIEYIINIILAQHKLNTILTYGSYIDIFTTIPPFFHLFVNIQNKYDLLNQIINISRIIRLIRFFRLFALFKKTENDVNKQIIMIINTLFMMVLIFAGLFQIFEDEEINKWRSISWEPFDVYNIEMRTSFHHYIYFVVVSISTVGYGDIVPLTIYGKILVVALVLFTLVLIPKQTNDLVVLMGAQTEWERKRYKASSDISHIILTGYMHIDCLMPFCLELFHADHGHTSKHAIIINSNEPSREIQIFMNEKVNENTLFYLQGDPMSEKDLQRADIAKAKACVIFNNKHAHDPYSADHMNILLGLYIKKLVYNLAEDNGHSPTMRICMQLIKPESKYHYYNALQATYKYKMPTDQLIIIEEIKMNLLAKSCITPGIMSLISNIVMSASNLPPGNDKDWLKEYSDGRGHEIYRILLSDNYRYMTFLEIVRDIYSVSQAIAFALELEVDKTSIIKLNPGEIQINQILSRLKDKEKYSLSTIRLYAYIICSDKNVADDIANRDKDKRQTVMSLGGVLASSSTRKQRHTNLNAPNESTYSFITDNTSDNDINTQNPEDFEILTEEYYFNKNNNHIVDTNLEIMQHTIKDSEEINDHIVVCGIHSALFHFILPLRAKYLGEENLKYIVILAPSLPQSLYEVCTKFPKIVFIQGSPLLPENLYRANIVNANKAVILSKSESIENENLNINDNQMLDAETIFIYKAIKKCNKNIQIMTELIASSNIEYLVQKNTLHNLQTRKDSIPMYEFTPIYASGEVFTPAIIDRITCQSYYNPHILTILEQILNGGATNKNKKVRRLDEETKILGSNLWLINVPEGMINESFETLFNHLIKSNYVVAIALYRKNMLEDFYYVYTNPKKSTLIRESDLIFVLGQYQNIVDLMEDRLNFSDNNNEERNSFSKESETKDSFNFSKKSVENRKNSKNFTFEASKSLKKQRTSKIMRHIYHGRASNYGHQNSEKRRSIKDSDLQKSSTTTKYIDIDNIKGKLLKLQHKMDDLRENYTGFQGYLNELINEEIDKEFKVYLNYKDNSFKN